MSRALPDVLHKLPNAGPNIRTHSCSNDCHTNGLSDERSDNYPHCVSVIHTNGSPNRCSFGCTDKCTNGTPHTAVLWCARSSLLRFCDLYRSVWDRVPRTLHIVLHGKSNSLANKRPYNADAHCHAHRVADGNTDCRPNALAHCDTNRIADFRTERKADCFANHRGSDCESNFHANSKLLWYSGRSDLFNRQLCICIGYCLPRSLPGLLHSVANGTADPLANSKPDMGAYSHSDGGSNACANSRTDVRTNIAANDTANIHALVCTNIAANSNPNDCSNRHLLWSG